MLFDKISDSYDDWFKTDLGKNLYQKQVKTLLSLATIRPGMKILDVGCGTGNLTERLPEDANIIYGIDSSEGMLAVAREKLSNRKNVKLKKMEAESLDFEDESFDLILSLTAFEFMSDKEAAFREMWRVLKNNGQLLIGTIDKWGYWGQIYQSPDYENDPIYSKADFIGMGRLQSFQSDSIFKSSRPTSNPDDSGIIAVSWLKEKKISCQLSFYPLNEADAEEKIDHILDLIKKSGIDHTIGDLSTILKGESPKLFDLLKEIHYYSQIHDLDYSMSLILSNECGC